MSYLRFQVRHGHSVKDDPQIAYALMNGTLLPRDAHGGGHPRQQCFSSNEVEDGRDEGPVEKEKADQRC